MATVDLVDWRPLREGRVESGILAVQDTVDLFENLGHVRNFVSQVHLQ